MSYLLWIWNLLIVFISMHITPWPIVHMSMKVRCFYLFSSRNIEGSYNVVQSKQASLSSASLLPKPENFILHKMKMLSPRLAKKFFINKYFFV